MTPMSDPAKAKAAAAYNAAAEHFDDEPLAFWSRCGTNTVERLSLAAGSTVLDVGCGSGASAIPAASRAGPAGRVVGVDLADRLLDRARVKAARLGLCNVEFIAADMEQMDYADGEFDAVISVFSIFFVPDIVRQTAELWRMVRPGGQLAITTWGPRLLEPGASAWWNAVKQHAPELHSTFAPWDRITTPEALGQLFADANIPAPTIVAEAGEQPLRSIEDWWLIVLGSGFRWTVDQMQSATAERVRSDNLHALHQHGVTSVETNVIYAIATKPTTSEA